MSNENNNPILIVTDENLSEEAWAAYVPTASVLSLSIPQESTGQFYTVSRTSLVSSEVEPITLNDEVVGSSPTQGTNFYSLRLYPNSRRQVEEFKKFRELHKDLIIAANITTFNVRMNNGEIIIFDNYSNPEPRHRFRGRRYSLVTFYHINDLGVTENIDQFLEALYPAACEGKIQFEKL